ncbi:MAG TPA: phospholipase D-like domain-containing protein [Verrucomicrobiae bacterium]|nr:phospholipase D-like domain-containing protein [Verrucomicrobiae bacterium]
MSDEILKELQREARVPNRIVADQAFSRAAGAPLIPGNRIRLLRDAAENYPAWLDAIRTARNTIHFESYIIRSDEVGCQFRDALAAKAREGVRVRLIYDWMGALGHTHYPFWRSLKSAGIEVRCFNPPRLDSPLGWLRRDHRKMLSVDGRIGFVTGLCVGRSWVGDSRRGVEPWRDTGVEIQGPAVADIEHAFAQMWMILGSPLLTNDLWDGKDARPEGDVALRIVPSYPNMGGLYRFDQLIGALARQTIWLTDAYFIGTASYIQSLRAAALDGVDVRLLLPRINDVPIVRTLSRAGYRTLLEAGVRIFEWNGSMLHAKTAVADGRWARVGSSNLNVASWLGNWELDVVVEHEGFAREMEQMYLNDLVYSTEIVLSPNQKVRSAGQTSRQPHHLKITEGSGGRAATGLLRVGNTIGAAITSRRGLGPAETGVLAIAAALLLCVAIIGILWPPTISIPVVVFCVWVVLALFARIYRLRMNQDR